MPALRNVNPLGEVDIPLVGQTVQRGAEFEVTDEHAAALLMQVGNYEPVDPASWGLLTVEQLQQVAAEKGVDTTGFTKKAEFVAAIKKG